MVGLYAPPHTKPVVEASDFTALGLDLGQSIDYSAGVMLESRCHPSNLYGPPDLLIRCRYIRKWPLGTDYMQIVEDALDLNPSIILPEFNGVGRVFVDILRNRARERGFHGAIMPVVSVGSNARIQVHKEARGRHVSIPKCDIVTAISLLQQQKFLRLPDVPETKMLLAELGDFQVRFGRSMKQFGNMPGQGRHDDLVIALGLAAWWTLRRRKEPAILL